MDDEAQINTCIISELRPTIQALKTEKDFLKEQQDESKKRIEELLSDLKRSTALREELEKNHAHTQLETAQLNVNLDKKQSDYNKTFKLLENFKNKFLSNSMQVTGMTICHTFRNISRHIEWGMLSDPQYMRGLLWHIQLRPVQSGMYLGIYLYCSSPGPSDGWSCRAKHKTALYANNAADDVLSREGIYKTYSSETPNWGRNHYVYWTELLTKYVKADSITVKMEIWIEQPQGV